MPARPRRKTCWSRPTSRCGRRASTTSRRSALVAQEGNVPYGTAKAAIVGFTRQLAPEIGPAVSVNVVAPGRVLTGLTEPLWTARGGGSPWKGIARASTCRPLGRIGRPEELAGTVCHAFSADAGSTTGSVVVIDGRETVI
ncbi:SDR family NAD(P)-dependent oxidoreductase [Streptomyces sp. SP18BB07]|uniref:SDR family NAD(P)-dependent oxidoreductase n=1 Tax=Streptomyces sp. SP18BB07 TaxID=3002522 RepID=UPI002E7922F6|nr:SDR family oxidoreductase [Streptomyces sp. SP18BB07]MEE1765181.1 SDR family NAD(P)-dependent oxidoreductase [Streptomyces sp. SP18BB07]